MIFSAQPQKPTISIESKYVPSYETFEIICNSKTKQVPNATERLFTLFRDSIPIQNISENCYTGQVCFADYSVDIENENSTFYCAETIQGYKSDDSLKESVETCK